MEFFKLAASHVLVRRGMVYHLNAPTATNEIVIATNPGTYLLRVAMASQEPTPGEWDSEAMRQPLNLDSPEREAPPSREQPQT